MPWSVLNDLNAIVKPGSVDPHCEHTEVGLWMSSIDANPPFTMTSSIVVTIDGFPEDYLDTPVEDSAGTTLL